MGSICDSEGRGGYVTEGTTGIPQIPVPGDSSGNAFITLLSTGAYRVKGTVNEINRRFDHRGNSCDHSFQVDSSKTWKGTMGSVDLDNSTSNRQFGYGNVRNVQCQ